jgi:hypothetical protein
MAMDFRRFVRVPPGGAGNLRILFLHHSTGRNLIEQGEVRRIIAKRNEQEGTQHELWDHDYNEIGLTDAQGRRTGISFEIPDDNTDPDGLETLFRQPVHDPPDNALSHLLSFDVVIFKSCFPVCAIRSDEQLKRYKEHYLSIRETLVQHPEVLFVAVTPPPLVSVPVVSGITPTSSRWTTLAEGKRARAFARWLTSEEFRRGEPNIAAFDLFDLLAGPENSVVSPNALRVEYRSGRLGRDPHPNERANRAIAPLFVDAIWREIGRFQQRRTVVNDEARLQQVGSR